MESIFDLNSISETALQKQSGMFALSVIKRVRIADTGHSKWRDALMSPFKTDQISTTNHWIRSSQNEFTVSISTRLLDIVSTGNQRLNLFEWIEHHDIDDREPGNMRPRELLIFKWPRLDEIERYSIPLKVSP